MASYSTLVTVAAEVAKETVIETIMASATISGLPTASACVDDYGNATDCPPLEDSEVAIVVGFFVVLVIPLVFVGVALYSNIKEAKYQREQVRNRVRNEIELAEMRRYWFPWEDALDEDELPKKSADEKDSDDDQVIYGYKYHCGNWACRNHEYQENRVRIRHGHHSHHGQEAEPDSDMESEQELSTIEADIAVDEAKANNDTMCCGRDKAIIESIMTEEVREEIRQGKEQSQEKGITTGADAAGDEGVVKRL
ncbi:hypothetical protein F5X68DRAFT_188519 [Plectosphaerella plurivora]|uniref:Uncharacterized protein n=1 Tax=Plectosphaerella plurivora TaxID=936078 RepID=A0A9P8VHJ6_9PEZI|nr:hypothetical protein F5X68DRAFT_188519 [Plectosphaerella plurivora]